MSAQDDETTIAELRQAEASVASAEAALAGARVNLGFTRITSPITGRIGKSTVTQGALVTANQTEVQIDQHTWKSWRTYSLNHDREHGC